MFELSTLPYEYNALEPHIDSRTMEIHHGKHHQAYVNNLNNATKDTPAATVDLLTIIQNISRYSGAIRNNGGGHWNHTFFWSIMKPKGGGTPTGALMEAINANFGSFEAMKEQFNSAGTTRFGSGWAWLIVHDHKLVISSTPNQDNPLMDVVDVKGIPILGLDVWEHAYYLHYQNRRPDYIAAFWNVVNWDAVSANFKAATH
ncbi:MAG: superoxide dismutase [Bacteroidetes bacterium]|nr:superoxide dismutase [Bacteroidota bacterium]PHX92625.1 MAG: superoxide dismutase [Flavobacteriales bacterium]